MTTHRSGLARTALFREAENAARQFGSGRAWRDTVRIWEAARWMDTPAVYRAAGIAARLLREAGIEDVRIETVPSDGRTSWNGWLMPVAWEVREARLESAGRPQDRESFADYRDDPQSIAVWSPPTTGGRWVEGAIACLEDADQLRRQRVRARFVYLRNGRGSIESNLDASRRGALGVITATSGPTPNARAYLNYHLPPDAKRTGIPHFSLSREAADRLDRCLLENPDTRLRAKVRASRHAGTAPMVTGTVGSGKPEVYLCAHIDEIGALDNASGCGVAVEALRTLHRIGQKRGIPPAGRAVRFFFSTEVRGQQAWFNTHPSPNGYLGGLNLDMVGSGAPNEPIVGRLGFPHRPHFAGRVLVDAMALADRIVPGQPLATGDNYVSDGVPGIHAPGGNVSIEQTPGPTYHTSADTPRALNRKALRWSGAATVAWLFAMTRMDGRAALRVARTIAEDAQGEKAPNDPTGSVRSRLEMETLFAAIGENPDYGVAETATGHYAAGVRRSDGLWPGVRRNAILRELVHRSIRPPDEPTHRTRRTRPVAPQMNDTGYLNFDAVLVPKKQRVLKETVGLSPAWCTETWAWTAATFFDGKHSIDDVVRRLRSLGIGVDPARLRSLARCLVDLKLACFRPVLGRREIQQALRKVGVRPGSTLFVHSSLSAFGYVTGGAATVIDTLCDVLGPDGSLIMPTHSNSILGYEPFDPLSSPSNTGAVTELFRKRPGVVRSAHPTHSVAGIGPVATRIITGHSADRFGAPMARDGFWGRFYDTGGDVLLMCPVSSATAFHAGETWAGIPQPPLVAHALDPDSGCRRVVTLPSGPWHTDHFRPTMARPLLRKGIMRSASLGESVLHRAPVRAMIDISIRVNRRNPLVSLAGDGACDCHYCRALRKGIGLG